MIGYSNSDFAGSVDTRKSTLNYVFILTGGVVSWKSEKKSGVVASTMKVEFVACFEATIQANWLQIGIVNSIARPLKMYYDNSTTIFFSKNNK